MPDPLLEALGHDWQRGPIPITWFSALEGKPLMILFKKFLVIDCRLKRNGTVGNTRGWYILKSTTEVVVTYMESECVAFKVMKAT